MALGINQDRITNVKNCYPPPPPPRWGLVSKASRIAVDSRSKGALRFCPAAVSQERKSQEGAGGHSSRPKGNEGRPFLYRGTSLLLGAVLALLAASNGSANGGSGGLPRRPQVNTQQCPECPVQQSQPNNCSGSKNDVSTLDLERVTTLIIEKNDTLKNLNLSNLEKLTILIIKGNNNLTQLKVPYLAYLTDIRIENNYNLRNIEMQNLKSLTLQQKWESFQSSFNHKSDFVIKRNNCLENLVLDNLKQLRELRIRDNGSLKEINLDFQKTANGEVSANSAPLFLIQPRGSPPEVLLPHQHPLPQPTNLTPL